MLFIKEGCQLLKAGIRPPQEPGKRLMNINKSQTALPDPNKSPKERFIPVTQYKSGQEGNPFNKNLQRKIHKISLKNLKGSQIKSSQKLKQPVSPTSSNKNGRKQRENKANKFEIQPIRMEKLQAKRSCLSDQNRTQFQEGIHDGERGSCRIIRSSIRKDDLLQKRYTTEHDKKIVRYASAKYILETCDPQTEHMMRTEYSPKREEAHSSERVAQTNRNHNVRIQNIQFMHGNNQPVSGFMNPNYKFWSASEGRLNFQNPSKVREIDELKALPSSSLHKQTSVKVIRFATSSDIMLQVNSRGESPSNIDRKDLSNYNFIGQSPINRFRAEYNQNCPRPESPTKVYTQPESPRKNYPLPESPIKNLQHNMVFNIPDKENPFQPPSESKQSPEALFKVFEPTVTFSPTKSKNNKSLQLIEKLLKKREQQDLHKENISQAKQPPNLFNLKKNLSQKQTVNLKVNGHQLVNSAIFVQKIAGKDAEAKANFEKIKQFQQKCMQLPTASQNVAKSADNLMGVEPIDICASNKTQTFRPFHKNANKISQDNFIQPKIVINASPEAKRFDPLSPGKSLSPKMTESQIQVNDDSKSQRSSSSIVLYGLGDKERHRQAQNNFDFWNNPKKLQYVQNNLNVTEESVIDPSWKKKKGKLGSTGIEDQQKSDLTNLSSDSRQGKSPKAFQLSTHSNNSALWKMTTVESIIGSGFEMQKMALNAKK